MDRGRMQGERENNVDDPHVMGISDLDEGD